MLISDAERFERYVVRGPALEDCWLWTGSIGDDGYGRFSLTVDGHRKAVRPQRFAYEAVTGRALSPAILLMHTCDIPICVHVAADASTHLVEGTTRKNMIDRMQKRRHANASSFRWRGVGRTAFVQRSRDLRAAVIDHGWDETILRPLIAGVPPDTPSLF